MMKLISALLLLPLVANAQVVTQVKISALPGKTGSSVGTNDVLPMVDVLDTSSAPTGTTKKLKLSDFINIPSLGMVGDSGSGGSAGFCSAPPSGSAAAGKYWSAAGTWSVPTGSGVTSVAATAPITSSGGTTPTIACNVASGSQPGCLASADWTTFNGKQAALSSFSCGSHQWADAFTSPNTWTCAQPAFSDISGSVAASQLPNPSASTLGGIESIVSASHQWIDSISTSGVPHQSQPAFSDISGSVSATQLPNPSSSTLGGIESLASVAHKWINTISTSGVPSATQPAFTDISGTATVAQTTVACQSLGTCATAVTVDWSTGNCFTVTLTNGDTCAVTYSNATSGQYITIDYYQPGSTGSAVVSYSTTTLWAGGTTPTMTTGASKSDSCTIKYNGTDYRGSCVQDMH